MSLTVNDQSASQCIQAGRYAPHEPMMALPFCCLLTSVHPTPLPPMSHISHLSHFASYQLMHLINPKVASSEAGGTPPDTPGQQYDRAPPLLWGGVGLRQTLWSSRAVGHRCLAFPRRYSRPIRPSFTPQILLMPTHLIWNSPQRPLPPYISSPPLLLHLLLSYLLRI